MRSGGALSSRRVWWMKLPLFSRALVGLLILSCIGWLVNLLNLAAWVRSLVSLRSSIGWSPVISSICLMGVERIAPVISLWDWFWIRLMLSKFDFAAVAQAVMPYSATGRTLPM